MDFVSPFLSFTVSILLSASMFAALTILSARRLSRGRMKEKFVARTAFICGFWGTIFFGENFNNSFKVIYLLIGGNSKNDTLFVPDEEQHKIILLYYPNPHTKKKF